MRGAIPDPDAWVPLGCDVARAQRLGDVVLTNGSDGLGVAVMCRVSPPLFLTAREGHGVCHVHGRSLQPNIVGVYRWERA